MILSHQGSPLGPWPGIKPVPLALAPWSLNGLQGSPWPAIVAMNDHSFILKPSPPLVCLTGSESDDLEGWDREAWEGGPRERG